jgi:hypothetical protein
MVLQPPHQPRQPLWDRLPLPPHHHQQQQRVLTAPRVAAAALRKWCSWRRQTHRSQGTAEGRARRRPPHQQSPFRTPQHPASPSGVTPAGTRQAQAQQTPMRRPPPPLLPLRCRRCWGGCPGQRRHCCCGACGLHSCLRQTLCRQPLLQPLQPLLLLLPPRVLAQPQQLAQLKAQQQHCRGPARGPGRAGW